MRLNDETPFDEIPMPWTRRMRGDKEGHRDMTKLRLHIDPPREADEPIQFPAARHAFVPRLAGTLPWDLPSGRMGPSRDTRERHEAELALERVEATLARLADIVDEDDDRPRAA